MRTLINLSIVGVFILGTIAGCCKKPVQQNCTGVICTMEFRGIMVSVKDSSGLPVLLDEWYTTAEDGIKLNIGSSSTTGRYVVVDDNIVQANKGTTKKYTFHGFRGKQEIAAGEYIVSVDCCHIKKVSGPDSITAR